MGRLNQAQQNVWITLREKSALKLQYDIFICLTWSTSSDKCFIYPEIVYHNAKKI